MKKTYCSECGREMFIQPVGAETYSCFSWGEIIHPYPKYDSKNGKRLIMMRHFCEKSSKWLFNKHDDYIEDKFL